MKHSVFAAALVCVAMGMAAASCSKADKATADGAQAGAKPKMEQADGFAPTTNIRYYNMDSVMANSDMVKAFNEVTVRTMNDLQTAQRSRETELGRIAANIQQKAQNNGYLSEASYNADVADYQNKQQAAQNYLGSLQAKAQEVAAQQQEEFLAALNNFLVEYNKEHHYDAILIYQPGELFNTKMDITSDVIKGINEAYKTTATPEPAADEAAKTADKK